MSTSKSGSEALDSNARAREVRDAYAARHRVAGGAGAMFDRIAKRYDLLNRVMSLGLDQGWRRRLVKALDVDVAARVLDVATGTADVALAISKAYPRTRIIGLDPSNAMLEIGRDKVERLGLSHRIDLVEGDAQSLPFDNGAFDASVVSFGIRNVPDRMVALTEMVRVTRTGGKVLILELNEPQGGWLAPLARFHVRIVVPRLGALLSCSDEYRYLQSSIAVFPKPAEFEARMHDAGLTKISSQSLGFGAATLFSGEVAGR